MKKALIILLFLILPTTAFSEEISSKSEIKLSESLYLSVQENIICRGIELTKKHFNEAEYLGAIDSAVSSVGALIVGPTIFDFKVIFPYIEKVEQSAQNNNHLGFADVFAEIQIKTAKVMKDKSISQECKITHQNYSDDLIEYLMFMYSAASKN